MSRGKVTAIFTVLALVVLLMTVGINDSGERTVVQLPNGTLFVKFSPGPYLSLFGTTTEYNDVITFDHDRNDAESGATLDQSGISVRYRDGGMGFAFGTTRYSLPTDSDSMLKIHRDFRGNRGLANKMIRPLTEEAMNLTAGLMTSVEGYDTKRAIFTQMAKSQIANGKFRTEIKSVEVQDDAGNKIITDIPVIVKEGGVPQHEPSDLTPYGIILVSMQLNDPGFEPKTMEQIAKKREATMDIMTAKANAEKAKQATITAEEEGKARAMTARYVEEEEKARQVVIAERDKQVAEITAAQKVSVAALGLDEAKQQKLTAMEIKEKNILEGEGIAKKRELIMKADGALQQKLDAYVQVNANYAREFGKQKWVPEIQMGSSSKGGEGNMATALIQMLTATTAKSIALDINPTKNP